MNLYFQLGLLTTALCCKVQPTPEKNPELFNLLSGMGFAHYCLEDKEKLRGRMINLISAIETQLAYYDASELLVNAGVNSYLIELLENAKNNRFDPEKNVAMMICALGNKNSLDMACTAIHAWLDQATGLLQRFVDICDGNLEVNFAVMQEDIKGMEYADRVLSMVDVFVTTRLGMLGGMEEFHPDQLVDLPEPPEADFEVPVCSAADDCPCGCKLDHAIQVIEGMEDYLNGEDTPASRYLLGVAMARGVRMSAVEGTEGAILDGIKDLAMKAWATITETFSAIKEWWDSSDSDAENKAVSDQVDANKKGLAAAKDTTGDQINPAAKAGLVKLAAASDPSGEFSTIVGSLVTKADASACLDKLLGLLQKQSGSAGKLDKQLAAAQKKLADLKTAAGSVTGKDEKNKEVVSTAKKTTQESIAAAKQSVKDLKTAVSAHKKLVSGIRKAANGISTKIFPAAEPKEEKPVKKE